MKWYLKIARRLLAASLLLAWLNPAPAARAQSAGPQYVVQAGDTLYGIARQFGVSLEALQAANPGVDPAALGIGQALLIPGYEGVSGTLAAHTLEPGESLDSLALRLGLKRETLIRLNRVVNPDRLYINESVVVVDGQDGGAAIPNGTTRLMPAGEGWLSLAASLDQNPWALAALNRQPHPGLAVAGARVVAPGGERPTTALPFPMRALDIQPFPAEQGRTLAIRLITERPLAVRGTLGDWPLHFNVAGEAPGGGAAQVALLGLHRLAEADLYPLTITAADTDGAAVRFSQPLPVRAGDYAIDPPLRVDPETIDPAVTEPELEQIRSIVAAYTPTRYWEGVFALPSVGGIRSLYGSLRSYNGGPYDSYHTGTDFSGAEDRPITAPAPGVVVFAGPLTVRGNATLIDHGWGVYTGYWHQTTIQVQAGEQVKTGQIIGYQGATGRVTGPHLHWEVWVSGAPVDPMQWTRVAFP